MTTMLAVYATAPNPDAPLDSVAVGDRPEPEVPDGWSRVRVRAGSLKAMTGAYDLKAVDLEGAPDGVGTEVIYQLQVDVKIPMLGAMKRKAEKMIVDTALKSLSERVVQ